MVNVHQNCRCNQLVSLHNRHLVDRSYIKYQKKFINDGFIKLKKIIRFRTNIRCKYIDIINKFSGSKKKQYYKAMVNLVENGFQPRRHAVVKMFVKPDKWPQDVSGKAPRAIQFRSKEYNLLLASYLEPIEKELYETIKWNGTRVVAKGLNNRERAELWMEKVRQYNDPIFINLDHSKFDSTVNEHHLRRLHYIYTTVCGPAVYSVLKHQLRNRCFARDITYTSRGTRCSGDYDTALGNTLINIACILQCFRRTPRFDFMLDGDDAIVVCDKLELDIGDFERFGFETVIHITRSLFDVEFCQSRLINAHGWVFVRNPIRAISNSMVINKPYGFKLMARYLAGVGLGELSMSKGVPILQQQGERLARASNIPYYTEDLMWQMANIGTKPEIMPVTELARVTMDLAWGISPAMQIYIESQLLPMTIEYIARADVRILSYDLESLYESWERVATLGCSSFAGWWEFGGGGASSILQAAYIPTGPSGRAADSHTSAAAPDIKRPRAEGPR